MPLPEPSEQDAASGLAGQEPEAPGTEVVPATPRKPRKFSKLILLAASKDSDQMASVKRQGVHCIMSLGVPGTATLTKALLQINPQRAIEAPQPEPERKRHKLNPDGKEDGSLAEPSAPNSSADEEGSTVPTAPTGTPQP